MRGYARACSEYERDYQDEPLSFEEIEDMAREYDDIMCALADEAYKDMKCRC